MDPRTIRDRLRAEPFEPFRAVTATGETYEFPIPRSAFVTKYRIFVGIDFEDGIAGDMRIAAPENIVRIEESPHRSGSGSISS